MEGEQPTCTQQHRTYKGRYYVLAVLSLLCALQNIGGFTFSAIAKEAKERYGLTDIQLTILPAYSPVCFLLLTVPFTWFLQKFGIRIVGVTAGWLLAIGISIRALVPFVPEASKWLWVMHIGHILISCVALPCMILPPMVSSLWFRPKERTFATAIVVSAQNISGFLLIPFLTLQYGIRTMLIVLAELSIAAAILVTIYFPSQPLTPPSVSAEKDRTSFKESFKGLIRNKGFLLLIFGGGIGLGLPFGFQSVLSIFLNKNTGNYDEDVVIHSYKGFFTSTSWLGFSISFFSIISSQLIGFIADRIQQRFKLLLCFLLFISALSFLWFSLSLYGYGSQNSINLFVIFCFVNVLLTTAFPIFCEAVVEQTYPIAEGTSTGVLILALHTGTLIFTIIGIAGVFSDKHPERAKAMTWVATGAVFLALLLVFFYSEDHRRLKVDNKEGNQNESKHFLSDKIEAHSINSS